MKFPLTKLTLTSDEQKSDILKETETLSSNLKGRKTSLEHRTESYAETDEQENIHSKENTSIEEEIDFVQRDYMSQQGTTGCWK